MTEARPGSRWLRPLYVHTVLIQAITFVLRPTAAYRALELDVPIQWLGVLGATFAIAPLLLAVPAGIFSDRWGERRVLVLGGCTTLAAALAFLFLADNVGGLLTATVLLGIGHLGCVVGQQAMVANRTPRERYDTAFGHYTFVASAGQAAGPGLIILFGGRASIPDTGAIFVSSVVMSVALIVASLFFARGPAAEAARTGAETGSVRELLRRRG